MDGYHLKMVEEFDTGFCGLEPKLPPNQPERHRVIGLFELDMTVAVDFDFGPGGKLWRDIGKLSKHVPFGLHKNGQRLLLGGAVNPSVGDCCLPMKQEVVFFIEAAEFAILQSVFLDVFVPLCHANGRRIPSRTHFGVKRISHPISFW